MADFTKKLAQIPVSNDVDMNKIYMIESSMNPNALNEKSQARGLGQITPIVLKEWNNFNPKNTYTDDQLFNPEINRQISSWYMNKRIPQMLRHFKIPDTVDNRLATYNWGIGRVKQWYSQGAESNRLPTETINYINKYGGR